MSRLSLITAAMVSFLVTPAVAQQTSGYIVGSGQPLAFSAAFQPAAVAVPGALQFNPDPNRRQALTRQILEGVRGQDPALAAAMGTKPFQSFGPALSAHQIQDNRLDHALAFMMLALWDAANASGVETTPGQTASVKQQAQRILAASMPSGYPAAGSVQDASDQIYLSALIFSILSAKVMEGGDPQAIARLQQIGSRESMGSFGVDFRSLALTESGLMPR